MYNNINNNMMKNFEGNISNFTNSEFKPNLSPYGMYPMPSQQVCECQTAKRTTKDFFNALRRESSIILDSAVKAKRTILVFNPNFSINAEFRLPYAMMYFTYNYDINKWMICYCYPFSQVEIISQENENEVTNILYEEVYKASKSCGDAVLMSTYVIDHKSDNVSYNSFVDTIIHFDEKSSRTIDDAIRDKSSFTIRSRKSKQNFDSEYSAIYEIYYNHMDEEDPFDYDCWTITNNVNNDTTYIVSDEVMKCFVEAMLMAYDYYYVSENTTPFNDHVLITKRDIVIDISESDTNKDTE